MRLSSFHQCASRDCDTFGVRMTLKLIVVASLLLVVSCATPQKHSSKKSTAPSARINNKTKFSTSTYGVKSSPRITTAKRVKKGGGRYQIGKPYKIRGKWYRPKDQPGYSKVGMASWYGPNFHGRLTANGEVYDQYALSAAHPTLPLPSYAKVTNLENGSSVVVRINDRGPFSNKRIIDLSARASKLLGYQKKGLAKVRVRYIGKAKLNGLDEKYLIASYVPAKNKSIFPQLPNLIPGASQFGTMIAGVLGPAPPTALKQDIPQSATSANDQPNILTASILADANIPVPALRPTPLNEGLPLNLQASGKLAFGHLQPLGYLRDNQYDRRINQAFSVIVETMD